MPPRQKKIEAYHEAGHVLVGWLLEHTPTLLMVTIEPEACTQFTPANQKLYTKEEVFDRMCIALGGRAAEALTFNFATNGDRSDLNKVIELAEAHVRLFDVSPSVGLRSLPGYRAYKLINQAYYRTENILKNNQHKLKSLAEELIRKETLNYKDVEAILGKPPLPQKKFIDRPLRPN